MSTAGSIVVDLLMRTGSFVTDAERAEKALRNLEKVAIATGVVMGTAISGAATTMTAMVKKSINSMDEISKAAQRAGMGTEGFSELAYGAGLADVSIGDLETTIGKMIKASADALDPSTKAGKTFSALGISAKDASGKLRPAIDLLYEFADAFKRQQGNPEIIAAGMQIFGKSFQTIIPLIKDGSDGLRAAAAEAAAFGHVISSEAGNNAEQFNDHLAKMKLWVTGLSNAVAAELLPDLVSMSGIFLDSAKNGEKLAATASRISDGLRVIATAAGWVTTGFSLAGETLATFMAQAHAAALFMTGDFAAAARLYAEASNGLDQKFSETFNPKPGKSAPSVILMDPADLIAQEKADAEAKRLRDMFGGVGKGKGKGRAGKTEAEKEAEQLARAYKHVNDQLSEQIGLEGKKSDAAKLDYRLTLGNLKGLSAAQKDELRDKQSKVDLIDAERAAQMRLSEVESERLDAIAAQGTAFKDQAADLQFELSLLRMSNKERAREIELRYLGKEATDEQRKAISALSDALFEQQKTMGDLIGIQDDMRASFADNFFDAIKGAKGATAAVKDFFDTVADSALQLIAKNITGSLFGEQGQDGGGMFGGLISSMFGRMFGGGGEGGGFASLFSGLFGKIGSMFGGSRAGGGDAIAGRGYWVGEEGPEWFEPRSTGSIVPTGVAMAAGGKGRSVVQNLNVSIAGRPDRRTPEQIARESGREAQRAMARTGR